MASALRTVAMAGLTLLGPTLLAPLPGQAPGALERLRASDAVQHAHLGVLVVDLEDDRARYEHHADRAFLPASTLKLVTTAVALHSLGPDHRLTTQLRWRGVVRDGILHGDLELVGGGDPSFGGRHETDGPAAPLIRMAEALRAAGVRRVEGRVTWVDEGFPEPSLGAGWAWDDAAHGYSAEVSGLCFAENCIRLLPRPTATGLEFAMQPVTDFASVDATVRIASDEEDPALRIQRSPTGNHFSIQGTVAAEDATTPVRLAVDDPRRFAVHVLTEVLARHGIVVTGRALDLSSHPTARVVTTEHSPPLSDLLVPPLTDSCNLYAEQLVRLAIPEDGTPRDMARAAEHCETVLDEWTIDRSGLRIADGSGLSRYDLATPRQLVGVLRAMWHSPHRDSWLAALPTGGVDGTLADRFATGAAHRRVLAKTGTMSGVSCLAGYVTRGERPPIAFAVMVDHYTAATDDVRESIDAFVERLAGESEVEELDLDPVRRR